MTPAGLSPADLVKLDPKDRARLFADALTRATTTDQIATIARAAEIDRWLASPVHLACRATADVGQPFKAYRWTTYLNRHLLDLAARRITFLIIEAPVRHGKSLLGSVWFPTWWLLTFPHDGVLLGAYNQTLARRFSRLARNNVEALAPRFLGCGLDPANRSNDDWRLAHPYSGGLRATGVGNPPTGMGGQLIVVDDPIKSRDEAYSPTYQEKLWEWWRFNMRTRLEPGGVVVIIMSRWHERDLVGRLLAQQASGALQDDDGNPVDRYTVLRLPALAEPGDPLGRAPGEALEPSRYSTSYLEGLRQEIGVYAFDALYQGSPRSMDGDLFPRVQWRFASAVPAGLTWVRAWDLAATEAAGDWTVGVRIARDTTTGYGWIDDVQRFQMGPGETRARIRATAEMDLRERNVRKIIVPQDPGQAGKAQAADMVAEWFTGLPVRAVPVPQSGSKVVRATPYAGVQTMGNIVLAVGPWDVDGFVAEHASFPSGVHDDQVDAAATGWNHVAGLSGNRAGRVHRPAA